MPVDPEITSARRNFVRGYCCAVASHLHGHGSEEDRYAKDMLLGVGLKDIELYAYQGDLDVFKRFKVLPTA